MGVQGNEGATAGCTHTFDVYPNMSDAATSPEPATDVCEVMVLPHPVIARSEILLEYRGTEQQPLVARMPLMCTQA